jgi:hypothetical protein
MFTSLRNAIGPRSLGAGAWYNGEGPLLHFNGGQGMERPTCKTCPYSSEDHDCGIGLVCHFNPPSAPINFDETVNGKVTGRTFTLDVTTGACGHWVHIDDDEWCGHHPDFPAYIASLKQREEAMS